MAPPPIDTVGEAAPVPPRIWQRRLGYALIAVWLVVGFIGIGSLAVNHTTSMPPPDDETKLTRAILAHRRHAGTTFVAHVIASDCSCTKRLFDHLLVRGAFPGVDEVVVFVGDDPAKQRAAESRGFGFSTVSAGALATHYALESAPVLLVFDAAGTMRYVGGYFDSPKALLPLDETIYAQVVNGKAPRSLPVFGCAVSPSLRKAVDPLGIVY